MAEVQDATSSVLRMQDTGTWFGQQPVGSGEQVSTAMNRKGRAVTVFVRPGTDVMCYQAGTLSSDGKGMAWGIEHEYERGYFPCVSINDYGMVVSVQQTNSSVSRRMFYRVGELIGDTIAWGPEMPYYDTGFKPSVSLNNLGHVAEVHQSASIFTEWNLHCWFGKLDRASKTIAWSGNELFSTGSQPYISLNNNDQFLIVQKTRGDGWDLWWRSGHADPANGRLVFNAENPSVGAGYRPRVALNDRAQALVVNVTNNILSSNYTQVRAAQMSPSGGVAWGDPVSVAGDSSDASVMLDNLGNALLVARWSRQNNDIASRRGFVVADPARWMEAIAPHLQRKTLRDVVLPGTHDSGTSSMTSDSNVAPDAKNPIPYLPRALVVKFARAQGMSIRDQLSSGVRYFDLRPAPEGEGRELKFVHALYGDLALPAVDAISDFLTSHPKEIVVLDFQHFFAMTDADHDRLAAHLALKLGPFMVAPGDPRGTTIANLWERGRRAVVIYTPEDGGGRILQKFSSIWNRDTWIHSPWADTDDLAKLQSFLDQATNTAPVNRLFVMQGVLTPQAGSYITLSSLEYLATTYNPTIIGWAGGPWSNRRLNIIMVDFSQFGGLLDTVVGLNFRNQASAEDDAPALGSEIVLSKGVGLDEDAWADDPGVSVRLAR
jgi:hypothetical protein